VFLDIDGVLNSGSWYQTEQHKTLRAQCRGKLNRADRVDQIDPKAVSHLNIISDWNFVLSSAWRGGDNGLSETGQLLKSVGFKGALIDKTPTNTFDNLRGNEVREWIKQNCEDDYNFNRYVIFDDDSDMLLWQKNNFFHVDGYYGISPNHIYKAQRFIDRTNNYD
jgi:hypothetical protein